MAKVRVAVYGTIGKSVLIDTDLAARVLALEQNAVALSQRAVSASTSKHSSLSGLGADDHPQYTMWQAAERITGQWQWTTSLWGPDGSAAAPAFAFTNDTDTGIYRIGANNLGIATGGSLQWGVNGTRTYQTVPAQIYQSIANSSTAQFLSLLNNNVGATDNSLLQFSAAVGGSGLNLGWQFGWWADIPGAPLVPPDTAGTGFRWANTLTVANQPDLVFYSHNGSAAGAEVYRHRYSTAQMLFVDGSSAAPTIAFNGVTSGIWWDAVNSALSFRNGGGSGVALRSTNFRIAVPIWGDDGTASAPEYTFVNDTNTGFYRVGTDILGIATGGSLRFQIAAAGQLGIGGATYGTSGHAFKSGGSGGAPTWGVLAEVGGGTNIATYTAGDMLYASATDTLAKRAIGATGDVLTTVGGVPTWRNLRLTGYTVAGLPAGTVGDEAYVTDALAPAFGAAVAGGGAVVVPVFRDATQWIVG